MMSLKHYALRSFFTQLIAAFVILIVITTIAVGAPAYWIISTELEKQTWARVEDAEHITQVALDAERARLANLALLAAQRPSLKQLAQAGDLAGLTDYLRAFQTSLSLDTLAVYDPSGHLLASGGPFVVESASSADPSGAVRALPGNAPGLALLASQPIHDNLSGDLLGYVVVGLHLDQDYAQQLAIETDFEQSIVMKGVRIATSLENAPSEVENPRAAHRALVSDTPQTLEQTVGGTPFYVALVPVRDDQGQPIALFEVMMPVDSLRAAKRDALAVLVLSALVVALLGTVLGGLYARRLTKPLKRLTSAAREIGQGDLSVALPFSSKLIEVSTLAAVLDESRTKIHRTLEALSRAKTWSETLIQSIGEGVITCDAEGRITFFSRGAAQITGWTGDDALGQRTGDVLNLSESETAQLIPAPGSKRQIQIVTRHDQRKTLEVTAATLIPPESDTAQTALVLRDITDQEIGRRLHSYFLGNITHEFRTPLSGLKASIELLSEEADYLSPDERRELLNTIHLSVSGLQALVDNLLESVNIEAGRFAIHRRPTDLNHVIADAIRVMQPLLDRRKQVLSLTEPLRLPLAQADPTRLTQVMINLLSNASKYSPLEATIDLGLEATGHTLRARVADRGAGIPAEERANLFNRFVRLSGSSTEQVGIGLGLSVVKAIVEGHGGDVGVEERPGGGSVFWFTLPLVGEVSS